MRYLIITALLLLVAGCATRTYWKIQDTPDGRAQFARDRYRCVQQSQVSWMAVGNLMIIGASIDAQRQTNALFVLCMEAAGYTQLEKDDPLVERLKK